MAKIILVQLGKFRSALHVRLPDEITCSRDDCVIVNVDRGVEFGRVVSDPETELATKPDNPHGEIVRVATAEDVAQIEENRKKAKEAVSVCTKKIAERKLDMHIVESEYTFDGKKIMFFFTADDRVDFRTLVKDLARVFKVRIELKQIGVRDKAKIIDGCGVCGRPLCCASYMKGFHPLSIKMAKEQNLPLNDSKIAGSCGRIKCCMAYEYCTYKEYSKSLPRVGERINTADGKGRVIDVNVLRQSVSVDLGEGKIKKIDYATK